MKVRIKNIGVADIYAVEFSFGNQYFNLEYKGTKEEATWMAKMLRKCFKNYKES